MGLLPRADASDLPLDTAQQLARLAPEQLEEVAVDAAIVTRNGVGDIEEARITAHDRHGEAVTQSRVDCVVQVLARDLFASGAIYQDLADLVLD